MASKIGMLMMMITNDGTEQENLGSETQKVIFSFFLLLSASSILFDKILSYFFQDSDADVCSENVKVNKVESSSREDG